MAQPFRGRSVGVCTLTAVGSVLAAGCGTFLERGFLDPSQLWSGQSRTLEIRKAITELDEPYELVGATEPTPEDLVPQAQEYRLGPGDGLRISILDLIREGLETVVEPEVDEAGRIDIPVVGWLDVAGQTASELQGEIKSQLRQRQLLLDPQVSVRVTLRGRQIYSVFGAVQAPGTFAIPRADFHLLEALIRGAGGIIDTARMVYVIRSPLQPVIGAPAQSAETPERQPGREVPPFAPATISDGTSPGGSSKPESHVSASGDAGLTTPPATTAPIIDSEQQREFIEAIAPAIRRPGGPPEPPATRAQTAPGLSKWIYLNGEWVEVPQTAPARPVPPRQPPVEEPLTKPVLEQAAVAEEYERRIIAVPAGPLRNGEAGYDVVIRPGDIIRVSAGPVGEFYMMGNVARPGAYQLTGRQVSLKQAVAAAGGLGPLAWPSRCEIVRRIGQDREQIIQVDLDRVFAGKDEDFFLKPDDIVNVGTHPITPFLASIRTAFRVSYGFGFVYDRNFADIDSFAVRANPENVRRIEEQTRLQGFPGLFP